MYITIEVVSCIEDSSCLFTVGVMYMKYITLQFGLENHFKAIKTILGYTQTNLGYTLMYIIINILCIII